MSHQPFEAWILEPGQISDEQRKQLDEHLTSCVHCQQLQYSWKSVENILRKPVMLEAPSGFTRRFQDRLAEKLARQQIRQVKRFFLIMAIANLLTLVILGLIIWFGGSPATALSKMIGNINSLLIWFGQFQKAVQLIFLSLPPVLSIAIWIIAMSSFAGLAMLWLTSIWRFSWKGGFTK